MKLLLFPKTDENPILKSNQLTKSLRLEQVQQPGAYGNSSSFEMCCSLPSSYNNDLLTGAFNYSETVLQHPQMARKHPGK